MIVADLLLPIIGALALGVIAVWLWVAFGVEEWAGRDRDRSRRRRK